MPDPLTIEQRIVPWLCRVFGHKWTVTHMLQGTPTGSQYKDQWIYYSHMCRRCFTEERRNLWPSI